MDGTKPTKSGSYLCHAINAIVLAGVIILFTGIYYCAIKAGIPYQDPPLELQIQYAVNIGIGENSRKHQFIIFYVITFLYLISYNYPNDEQKIIENAAYSGTVSFWEYSQYRKEDG